MAAPAPVIDEDSAPFWGGLRDHRIVLQQCRACERRRFPPMPSCPWCAAIEFELVEADGHGAVYSWVAVHRALTDDQRDEVPYTVAVIDMVGGGRLLGRLEGAPAPGAAVEAAFVDHDEWTELRFRVDR